MKLCRFKTGNEIRIGLVTEDSALVDLTPVGIGSMESILESEDPVSRVNSISQQNLPRISLADVKLCPPVEKHEVWAAGVTYLRSKTARMEESNFSATA